MTNKTTRTAKWYNKKIQQAQTVEELEVLLLMACLQTTSLKMKRKTLAKIVVKIKEKNETWKAEKNTTDATGNSTKA